MCYVRTISQRQLRNDNAEVMRRVEQGESFTVTRRGVPVARLSPINPESDLKCVRPATSSTSAAGRRRVQLPISTTALLGDLRGDR